MSRNTTTDRLLAQFVSTFKEWHYFAGGGAIGFVVGFVAALYFVIKSQQRYPVVPRDDDRLIDL